MSLKIIFFITLALLLTSCKPDSNNKGSYSAKLDSIVLNHIVGYDADCISGQLLWDTLAITTIQSIAYRLEGPSKACMLTDWEHVTIITQNKQFYVLRNGWGGADDLEDLSLFLRDNSNKIDKKFIIDGFYDLIKFHYYYKIDGNNVIRQNDTNLLAKAVDYTISRHETGEICTHYFKNSVFKFFEVNKNDSLLIAFFLPHEVEAFWLYSNGMNYHIRCRKLLLKDFILQNDNELTHCP